MPILSHMNVTLSDSAIARLETLRQKQNKERLYLCVIIDGGGCQGFEYSFDFKEMASDADLSKDYDNVGLITDPASMAFLDGAEVDFKDELIGAKFVINNPNATSSCGCGTSFNVS